MVFSKQAFDWGGKGVRKVGGQIEKGSSQIKNFKADSLPKILRLENRRCIQGILCNIEWMAYETP